MERYVFKVMGPGDKWIKLFLSSEEIASLTMDSLLSRIQERFPSLRRSTVSVKYYDGNDWIELPADDIDSFIDMLESAQEERENLKRVTLRVNEIAFSPPGLLKSATVQTVKTAQQKRLRSSPSSSPNAVSVPERKKHKIATSRCLEEEFCDTTAEWKYETPTQKYFNKLEEEKKQQQDLVLRKQNELLELDMSSAKTKLKKLEEDIATKRESFVSSINTYAAKVQADLINSNQAKYLRQTATGDKVPMWLIVNTDIRKLEKICNGKVSPKGEIQQLLKEYDENFSVTRVKANTDHSINPVRKLWERKGIVFPGSGVLPNQKSESVASSRCYFYGKPTSTPVTGTPINACSSQLLRNEPTTLEEEERHLERGLSESLKTCPPESLKTCPPSSSKKDVDSDYGLSLLFEAAKMVGD
ncbi:hypothetical protein ACROYT_G005567 [Oculina patagonica]